MQYPQIQFYKGSLVRLASGQLKPVEDLTSDDFVESARLTNPTNNRSANNINFANLNFNNTNCNTNNLKLQSSNTHLDLNNNATQTKNLDLNNNSNGINSPYQQDNGDRSYNHNEEDEDIDIEIDVEGGSADCKQDISNHNSQTHSAFSSAHNLSRNVNLIPMPQVQTNHINDDEDDDIQVDSSVVKDFLEVNTSGSTSTSPCSSTSDTSSAPCSSVLIKFFLESNRSIVFIEVPTEHPFFVFHHGWSSWNPQRTFDKYNLMCRKLKIGDRCISLIRRSNEMQHSPMAPKSAQSMPPFFFASPK